MCVIFGSEIPLCELSVLACVHVPALVNFPCAPTYPGRICRCGHRFLGPPPVPLTVLRGDGQADDPSLTRTHHTTPGHIPAHQHPFEPLRANRIWGAGWVDCFGRCVPDPLRGAGLPRPPVGGWGGYSCALWSDRRWFPASTHLDRHSIGPCPRMGGRGTPPPRGERHHSTGSGCGANGG